MSQVKRMDDAITSKTDSVRGEPFAGRNGGTRLELSQFASVTSSTSQVF